MKKNFSIIYNYFRIEKKIIIFNNNNDITKLCKEKTRTNIEIKNIKISFKYEI